MIARSIVFFLILIVLPDIWLDYRYLRPRRTMSMGRRLLWWIPCLLMLVFTCCLAGQGSFIPQDRMWVDVYLWIIWLFLLPKAVFSICTYVGSKLAGLPSFRPHMAEWVGGVLAVCLAGMMAYGATVGFSKVEVKHVDIYFDDLPPSFDGFRIVVASDLHVGTYDGKDRDILSRVVDSIQAQKADMVCLVGDIQNVTPDEVQAVSDILSRIDNVYSVLGNHDYADYAFPRRNRREDRGWKEYGKAVRDSVTREEMVRKMKDIQRYKLGFNLLDNEHRRIVRDSSAIYVVGTGNYNRPSKKVYSYSDFGSAMKGVPHDAFVIMLQHNPRAWNDVILHLATAGSQVPQLTLSGHTHGGQIGIGPVRPTNLLYSEDKGLYESDGRHLYVTSGVGGLVPIRLGISPEIVVITMRSKASQSLPKGEE